MAFSDLLSNQMVSRADAATGGFTLKSGVTNPNDNLMITKSIAFSMFNLSATAGSDGIAENQLMQKNFWLAASASVYRGNLVVGSSGSTYKTWGYQRNSNNALIQGSLTNYNAYTALGAGYVAGIVWYNNYITMYIDGLPQNAPPTNWNTLIVDGNAYSRGNMSNNYDGSAGWFTFSIYAPTNIMGYTNGVTLRVDIY